MSSRLRAIGSTLVLLTVSIVLSLLAAEVAVRWLAPQPVGLSWMSSGGLLVHIPGRETTFRRSEYAAAVRINAMGFRGGEFRIPKPPGTFRVLALGDSFLEGLQVGNDELLTSRIEADFSGSDPRVEVLNLGVTGYGTTEALDLLDRFGPELEPDLVVLFFCLQNDVRNNVQGRCRLEDGSLACTPRRPLSGIRLVASRFKSFLGTHSQLYQVLRIATASPVFATIGLRAGEAPESLPGMPFADDQYLAEQPGYQREGLVLTAALLERLRERAQDLGAETWMVLVPGRSQVENDRWAEVETALGATRVRRDQPQRALRGVAEQVGIPVIDLFPAFRARDARGERLYWNFDAHFNAAGHDEAARVVADALRARSPTGAAAGR